jgi:hypothetical protein
MDTREGVVNGPGENTCAPPAEGWRLLPGVAGGAGAGEETNRLLYLRPLPEGNVAVLVDHVADDILLLVQDTSV